MERDKDSAYNCAGHDEGPQGGHGIGIDGLEHAHLVLGILCLDGAGLVDALLLVGEGAIVDMGDADGALELGLCLGLDSSTHVWLVQSSLLGVLMGEDGEDKDGTQGNKCEEGWHFL
jgi:hypothetical protein